MQCILKTRVTSLRVRFTSRKHFGCGHSGGPISPSLTVSELDEVSPLQRQLHLTEVAEGEVDETLQKGIAELAHQVRLMDQLASCPSGQVRVGSGPFSVRSGQYRTTVGQIRFI